MVSLAMFQQSSKLMKHLKAFSKIKWNSVQLYLKDEHSDSDLNDWFADYGCEASGSAFCPSQSSIFLFQNILGWKTAHLEKARELASGHFKRDASKNRLKQNNFK